DSSHNGTGRCGQTEMAPSQETPNSGVSLASLGSVARCSIIALGGAALSHIYQKYIDHIIDFHEKMGMQGATQPPCPEDQIRRLKVDTQEILYCQVPDQYIEFLRITNGLEFNGVGIYAAERSPLVGYEHMPERDIQGFVDANLDWRGYEPHEDYLFFGSAS